MYADSSEPDLNQEYSPSLCTKRFQDSPNPNERVMENFLKIGMEETQRVRSIYKMRENVRYGGVDDNQVVDIYYKERENDTPIFVFIHGGYWQLGDKAGSALCVAPLVERGYRVVVVGYNLCPVVTLQQQTEQIGQFFDWLYKYAKNTNASKITLSGHSAGAHLLSLVLDSKFPKLPVADRTTSIFLISGLYDLRELWNLVCANPNDILSLDATKATELSPFCWDVDKQMVKFCNDNKIKIHVLVAENESATFIGQSREYAKKLKEAGLNAIYKLFEIYDHFDIYEEVFIEGSAINRYIIANL